MKLCLKAAFYALFAIMMLAPATPPVMAAETVLPVTAYDSEVNATLASLQVPFVQNQGQVGDNQVKFYAQTFAGTVFVTGQGVTYALNGKEGGWVLREEFAGAAAVDPVGGKASSTTVNSFLGNDPNRWKSDLPTFEEVALGKMYDKIDVKLRAYGDNMEKIFTIAPGGNPDDILVKVNGAEGININSLGELELATGMGEFKMTSPVAYQEIDGQQINVAVTYELKDDGYGFAIGSYDPAYPLIIDPLLASTFLGGTKNDYVSAQVLDPDGNIIITGRTNSTDFPITTGSFTDGYEVFIAKLSSDLGLLGATYLGGSKVDIAQAMAIDSDGNIYITGYTSSSDFPIEGGYSSTFTGSSTYCDVFIAKLSNELTLLASSYHGGSKKDTPYAIALDSGGHVFIAGETQSTDLLTTTGAYDTSYSAAYYHGFVAKLKNDLSELQSSSLLGGDENSSYIYAMAVDSSDNVYLTGETSASDFPVTSGTYQTSFTSGVHGFISKMNNDLTELPTSTFFGTSTIPYAMTLDSAGNLYIAGTGEAGVPTTASAYRTTCTDSNDAFVSKLNSNLLGSEALLASTYIGGDTYTDNARAIALDTSGNIYIAGETFSENYPVTEGAFDTQYVSGEAFISKLKADLTGLMASTFLGGADKDYATAISLDSAGNVYIAGYTKSTDFPSTTDVAYAGSQEAFISKFSADLLLEAPVAPVWSDGSLTASDTAPTGLTLSWSGASESEENGGITGYKIYQNDAEIATVEGTVSSYAVTGLSADNEYTFKVEAGNGLGNWSTDGPVLTIVFDLEAPTWPNGSTLRVDS